MIVYAVVAGGGGEVVGVGRAAGSVTRYMVNVYMDKTDVLSKPVNEVGLLQPRKLQNLKPQDLDPTPRTKRP